MAFNHIQRSRYPLSEKVLELLESIDEFPYNVLNPRYNSLGDIHNEITVEVVDNIDSKEYTLQTTLEELRQQLKDIENYNEEVKKYNEQLSEEDWKLKKSPIDTDEIESLLKDNKGKPDNTIITRKVTIEKSGYYTRDANNNGLIVLKYDTDAERLASTYIHEMMHAFYDWDKTKPMQSIEYIEEPLAEYGMLHLLFEYDKATATRDSDILLRKSYNNVERKQHTPGIAHYGFGAHLFNYYMHIPWENLLADKQPRPATGEYYQVVQQLLKSSWPAKNDLRKTANNIYYYLTDFASKRITSKQSDGMSKIIGIWIMRVLMDREDNANLNAGDRLWFTNDPLNFIVNGQTVELFSNISQFIVWHSGIANPNQSLKLIVTKTNVKSIHRRNVIEAELSYIGVKPSEIAMEDATAIHFIKGIEYQMFSYAHNEIKTIVIDSDCKDYYYDKANNVLLDSSRQKLILGFDNSKIPNSVTKIGDSAFNDCTGLTSITIPDSVTEIERGAFANCEGLTSITIPNSVTEIVDHVFLFCYGLNSITIPDSVTEIGEVAFFGCSGLTSIAIPNGVTAIGNNAFKGCTSLTSITIPDSVTEIGYSTFEDCTSLTSITIPDSVTKIGYYAFLECTSLTSITIPANVKTIAVSAFYGCHSLEEIIFEGPTTLERQCFAQCRNLKSIEIKNNAIINADADTFFASSNFVVTGTGQIQYSK